MTNHISDDLPRLLTGEATRDAVLTAAAHLRTCPDCQQELVAAVVAHASLTSAHRFAPEIVTRPTETDESDDADPEAAGEGEPQLPDMSAVFATARGEAERSATRQPRHAVGSRRRLLAVAAAVAVLAGGGIAIAETVGSSSAPAGRTVALEAYDDGTQPAQARIVDGRTVVIDASQLPKLDGDRSYEVWLTNAARNHMVSIGFIGGSNTASLPVKADWLAKYSDIEVSVQRPDQTGYSGTSVLRGSYS